MGCAPNCQSKIIINRCTIVAVIRFLSFTVIFRRNHPIVAVFPGRRLSILATGVTFLQIYDPGGRDLKPKARHSENTILYSVLHKLHWSIVLICGHMRSLGCHICRLHVRFPVSIYVVYAHKKLSSSRTTENIKFNR